MSLQEAGKAGGSLLEHTLEVTVQKAVEAMCVCSAAPVVSDSLRPRGLYVAAQAPLSMEFSGREYWSGLPFPL